ncbi:helix-turn-helix transcriptional regulator [Schinkia azotoformans]|uniref:XRE family transcriptional regulator n=1 Tax=Schinkia azotoformans LMG 9581 TaxID=1131731 RepID=K6DHP8_SCHAZ|nr:helix-turn-helix transcriptional regulator [Schinkia azotoformans]EKN67839.1 XRE family transcriptional regulator [Schinkia azotoformans LMG 9581]MEC1637396.1 helix-turn-helix transcriptional regulator [Schinkia azotoformans]MEC1943800.1 helix-turn-helix transcriptional regulator [Schinkia azotoformans]
MKLGKKRRKAKKIYESSKYFSLKGAKRERLVNERKNLKLTQSDVAKKLGVSISLISSLESNRSRPSLEVALKLQELYDVPLEQLFPDDNDFY